MKNDTGLPVDGAEPRRYVLPIHTPEQVRLLLILLKKKAHWTGSWHNTVTVTIIALFNCCMTECFIVIIWF